MCDTQKPQEAQTSGTCSEKGTDTCQKACDQPMKVEHNVILMLDPVKKQVKQSSTES